MAGVALVPDMETLLTLRWLFIVFNCPDSLVIATHPWELLGTFFWVPTTHMEMWGKNYETHTLHWFNRHITMLLILIRGSAKQQKLWYTCSQAGR